LRVFYVSDLFSRKIKTIDESQPMKEAAKMMNNMGISSLIVVNEGKAVGIITEQDMMRSLTLNLHKVSVRTFMSSNLITIKENGLIEDSIELMVSNKIKRLLVTGAIGTESKLIGIISMTDIVIQHPELRQHFDALKAPMDELDNYPYLNVMN
jgi:predicted transcriptional regulator